jgi:hypothetical protein
MSSRVPRLVPVLVLITATACLVSGCRQTDGPMPSQQGDVPNRLGDLGRDLMSVSRGDAQAREDFADDLRVFIDNAGDAEATAAVDELSSRVVKVVTDRPLSEQQAQQLAERLWTAVAAQQLSDRQVDALQTDLQRELVAVGVAEDAAQNVAAQVEPVQRAVSTRQRRWYEFF